MAFIDKVLPRISGTFKKHGDAVTYLDFQKAFDNVSLRLLKKYYCLTLKREKVFPLITDWRTGNEEK